MPGSIRIGQTTEVVDPLFVAVEEAKIIAKTEEEAVVTEDVGVIRDVDLAKNGLYDPRGQRGAHSHNGI